VWRILRPDATAIARHLGAQRALPFSYPEVGRSRDGQVPSGYVSEPRDGQVPSGYKLDHNRQLLGRGEATFAAAKDAIRGWRMFPAWAAIEPRAPIARDEVIAIVIRAGVWWLNAARIVYVIDEPRRFGFAYGTLPGHAERGEERFSVDWLSDDSVWYDLRAFSRPRHWAAWLAYPVTRALQRRFVRHSKAAMATTCSRGSAAP